MSELIAQRARQASCARAVPASMVVTASAAAPVLKMDRMVSSLVILDGGGVVWFHYVKLGFLY